MKARIGMVICLIGIVICIGVIVGMIIINNNSNTNVENNPVDDNINVDNNVNESTSKEENNKEELKLTIKEVIIDENGYNEGELKEYSSKVGEKIKYDGTLYSTLEFEIIDVLDTNIVLKTINAVRSDYNDMDGISVFDDMEEFTIKEQYPMTYATVTASTSVSYIISIKK